MSASHGMSRRRGSTATLRASRTLGPTRAEGGGHRRRRLRRPDLNRPNSGERPEFGKSAGDERQRAERDRAGQKRAEQKRAERKRRAKARRAKAHSAKTSKAPAHSVNEPGDRTQSDSKRDRAPPCARERRSVAGVLPPAHCTCTRAQRGGASSYGTRGARGREERSRIARPTDPAAAGAPPGRAPARELSPARPRACAPAPRCRSSCRSR